MTALLIRPQIPAHTKSKVTSIWILKLATATESERQRAPCCLWFQNLATTSLHPPPTSSLHLSYSYLSYPNIFCFSWPCMYQHRFFTQAIIKTDLIWTHGRVIDTKGLINVNGNSRNLISASADTAILFVKISNIWHFFPLANNYLE